jgi:hypothetical protein
LVWLSSRSLSGRDEQHLRAFAVEAVGVTTHVNKVRHVTTITRVAEQLGEDEDWIIAKTANKMPSANASN